MDARGTEPLQVCGSHKHQLVLGLSLIGNSADSVRADCMMDCNLVDDIRMSRGHIPGLAHIRGHVVELNRSLPVLPAHSLPVAQSHGLREAGFVKLPIEVRTFRQFLAAEGRHEQRFHRRPRELCHR